MSIILITGGARSGKSDFAQRQAMSRGGNVLFVATAEALDDEMARRVQAHRVSRPAAWNTLEAPADLDPQIRLHAGNAEVVLIDCITLLVSNILGRRAGAADEVIEQAVRAEIDCLIVCSHCIKADFIIVTNEVGLGIVPENAAARLYRDLLGRANQQLAAAAEEVYFMVSGLPLRLKPASA